MITLYNSKKPITYAKINKAVLENGHIGITVRSKAGNVNLYISQERNSKNGGCIARYSIRNPDTNEVHGTLRIFDYRNRSHLTYAHYEFFSEDEINVELQVKRILQSLGIYLCKKWSTISDDFTQWQ